MALVLEEFSPGRDGHPEVCEGWLESVSVAGALRQCSKPKMTDWIKTLLMESFAAHVFVKPF
jgi:hypothetical protein